ncbi:hypothetical protein LTS16_022055 [Friedmanniomyces endolithicus]|nr:hypothetical protein LTS02_009819 [Friedmanniomyces endolithicus]KAK0878358.1 hypothetical protein LTR87_007762 [Friedmanniomyces endolithicus]KAK0912050.1 hypothetical protein LTR57_015022 [Friedmanniomyces endolithicus]KAK1002904.1 hypothetical protein LTS01_004172 [Friedmanniomyces endolithicus]KAK1026786.1 hypothetical protein LTS16_022055 [Friedmanniomyces endolithicus]
MNTSWPNASAHLNPAAMYANHYDQFQPTTTPAPTFNANFQPPPSVVPAKRTHDGSPQQSRSQTPSYNFSNQSGQQYTNAPTPYQHLQQPASNATPSPTLSNQPYRQPQQQQSRMSNASPSPFPQPQGNFGNQMAQQQGQAVGMAYQGQAGGFNGMGTNNMGAMPGIPSSMSGQMNNAMAQVNAQRTYQMKLQQQRQAMQMSGTMPQRTAGAQPNSMNAMAGQQPGGQMSNGQSANAMVLAQQQAKRTTFLKALASNANNQGRQLQPNPVVCGRPLDLYMLWSFVAQAGGSGMIDRNGQWPAVAAKFGIHQAQFPTGVAELKQLYSRDIGIYERAWFNMKAQQKQEQARQHAHQMAGLGGPTTATPNRTMQPTPQQNQYAQFQQAQQAQQAQQPPQATPVQAHSQLPQNGMSPQQMMHHRRNSSIRKTEHTTPQPSAQSVTAPSPGSGARVQRSPSVKQELPKAVMKSEEPQDSNYMPHFHPVEHDGGFDIPVLQDLGNVISRAIPTMPTIDEMGVIDMRAITLSLACGIHAEVRYALDALVIVSKDERIHFELEKCEDLMDVIVDCAGEQLDLLSDAAPEVSDALDLPSYEDVMRGCRTEMEATQDVPAFGTPAYELDRAADRLIAITTIMRNFSFYEHNHNLLTSEALVKWLSTTIRFLGTRNLLLRTLHNTLDFYKDIVIFLSNITQSLELPGKDDALHILHFLLAFAPQPAPTYDGTNTPLTFPSFAPSTHRYLPPAIDCLAKLLARQDPNRMLYRQVFSPSPQTNTTNTNSANTSPLDLLTRAFALSISVLPDRSKSIPSNTTQLRIVEARKSYLCQGMLAADILTTLVPGNDPRLARAWMESDDGWVVSLLNLASLLSVDRSGGGAASGGGGGGGVKGGREIGPDTESFRLITHRALGMMKRLAEKAGRGGMGRAVVATSRSRSAAEYGNGNGYGHGSGSGAGRNGIITGIGDVGADPDSDAEDRQAASREWEGIPQGHAILGALLMPSTDKVALGLLCSLHEMAMQG